MTKEREALKRLKQETVPATYNADADTFKDECLATLEAAIDILELIKPLCKIVETPVRKDRYLIINGVVVYTFKTIEQYNLFKEWLESDN